MLPKEMIHMPKGGARNRSGPPPDERSRTSERRGYSLTALPATYDGPIPDWPLPIPATPDELEAWTNQWRGPHGAAWSQPSEAWRIPFVARWARLHVRCSAPDAPGNLFAALYREEDRIGLSSAGLAAMGWKVKSDELADKREQQKPAKEEPATKPQRRLRAADAQR